MPSTLLTTSTEAVAVCSEDITNMHDDTKGRLRPEVWLQGAGRVPSVFIGRRQVGHNSDQTIPFDRYLNYRWCHLESFIATTSNYPTLIARPMGINDSTMSWDHREAFNAGVIYIFSYVVIWEIKSANYFLFQHKVVFMQHTDTLHSH